MYVTHDENGRLKTDVIIPPVSSTSCLTSPVRSSLRLFRLAAPLSAARRCAPQTSAALRGRSGDFSEEPFQLCELLQPLKQRRQRPVERTRVHEGAEELISRIARVWLSLSVKSLLTRHQIELLTVLQPFLFTPPEENKQTHSKYQFPPAIVGLPAIYRKIPFLLQSGGNDQTVILALPNIKQFNFLKCFRCTSAFF